MIFVEYIFSLPPFILIIYFFVTGSIFGSFANVLIHRTLRMIREEEEEEESEKKLKEPPLSSVSENSSDHPEATIADSETLHETIDNVQEVPPISLKERFTDRIMQHVEVFYCLFIFCVKKPVRFVWRWILSAMRILQPGKRQKNKQPHLAEKEESFPLDLMGHSRCPHCDYKIPFYLNIPILSWFFLKGRCRNCKATLSFRYPLVEFLMACLFTGLFVSVGWKWFLLEALIFVFGLVVVSFIDWDRMILPSFFTLPGIYLGLVGGFLNPERPFSSALIGWLAGGFILWLSGYLYFKIRNQEGMGDGDVSLMGWIGAVLGWKSISFVLIISCFFGVVFGIWGILRNRKDARTPFPFGPCLATGAVCYLFIQFLASDILRIFSPF